MLLVVMLEVNRFFTHQGGLDVDQDRRSIRAAARDSGRALPHKACNSGARRHSDYVVGHACAVLWPRAISQLPAVGFLRSRRAGACGFVGATEVAHGSQILLRREAERLTCLSKASSLRKMEAGTFPLPLELPRSHSTAFHAGPGFSRGPSVLPAALAIARNRVPCLRGERPPAHDVSLSLTRHDRTASSVGLD